MRGTAKRGQLTVAMAPRPSRGMDAAIVLGVPAGGAREAMKVGIYGSRVVGIPVAIAVGT